MSTTTLDIAVQTETGIQTFNVDPSHSSLGFVVRHLGFSKVRGAFDVFEGEIEFDPSDLASLEADASIETESVNTNEDNRDEHLRSADFFDVENYPTITFKSTDVRVIDDSTFKLIGEFSLHGVTKTIELDAEYLGESPDPWGGTRIGFEARTKINRKDYGLNWNVALEAGGFLVGEEVEIVLEIQAVKE